MINDGRTGHVFAWIALTAIAATPVTAEDKQNTPPHCDATTLHVDFENYTDGVVQPLNAGVRWLGDPFSNRDEGTVEMTRGFAHSGSRCAHVRADRRNQIARVRLQCRHDAPQPHGDSVIEFMFRAGGDEGPATENLTVWSSKSARGKPTGLVIFATGGAREDTYRLDVVHAEQVNSPATARTNGIATRRQGGAWTHFVLHRRRGEGLCDLWVGKPGSAERVGSYPDLSPAGDLFSIELGDTSQRKFRGEAFWDDVRVGAPRRPDRTVAPPEPPLRDVGTERAVLETPIVVGPKKQLLVDNAVIESMTGLNRTLHPVEKHPANPLVVPDRTWEGPAVLLYGAVVRDPDSGIFRMWYLAWNSTYAKEHNKPEERSFICYAESNDGLTWIKPNVGRYVYRGSKQNNIVIGYGMSNTTVIHDPRDPDPTRRYKGVLRHNGLRAYLSSDGLDWRDAGVIIDQGYDSTTVHWDPIGEKWIASVKIWRDGRRARGYAESKDFFGWTDTYFMADIDERDAPTDQIYAMTVFHYETVYLGLLRMYHTVPDLIDIELATSRNARRWEREFRAPFIPTSSERGAWDYGNNAPATNPPLRVGDKLWFYYSGRSTRHDETPNTGAIGLGTLRVDGFVSVDASTTDGVLTTKPLRLEGDILFVNADASGGELRAEITDDKGAVLPGFSLADCTVVRTDGVRLAVRWSHAPALSSLGDKAVRLRLKLHDARLFAFWVE